MLDVDPWPERVSTVGLTSYSSDSESDWAPIAAMNARMVRDCALDASPVAPSPALLVVPPGGFCDCFLRQVEVA